MSRKRTDGKSGQDRTRGSPASGRRASRKPFLLRVPPALLDELRAWANQDLRSLNGQIEYLLQEAVRRRRKGS